VSWRPRAYVLHGFLSDEECDHLVKAAEPSLARSLVVAANGTGVLDSVRTSSGTFLPKGQDSIVARVESRVSAATHLPVSHAENLQVLRYELGQQYRAHWDTIEVAADLQKTRMYQNQRTLTLLMYLTDVEEGGETSFPAGRWLDAAAQLQPPYTECGSKGVAVKPRKGDALLFHSLHIDGKRKDAFSYHAGCPVVRGVKYSATSWAHVEPFLAGGVAATATPQASSVCRDNNDSCRHWASIGECEKNPVYMKSNCRLSCKVGGVAGGGVVGWAEAVVGPTMLLWNGSSAGAETHF
jgi:prolyl 4-hydroxylase